MARFGFVFLLALLTPLTRADAPPRDRAAGPGQPYATWLETRAPGAFDATATPVHTVSARYRIDARVMLPLGFTSLPIWSRHDVGAADALFRETPFQAGSLLRTFELFARSNPARARGYDRRGLFREAIRLDGQAAAWTAYFGCMTAWPEKTLDEARRSGASRQSFVYDAIDGMTSPLETRAAVFRVSSDRAMAAAGDVWSALRPLLDGKQPRYQHTVDASATKPLPSLAFLGALQTSLAAAVVHRGRGLRPGSTRIAFMHNELQRHLEIESMAPDPGRGREWAQSGLVRVVANVYELKYRVSTVGGGEGRFRAWIELPDERSSSPQAFPLAAELPLRPYLTLVFVRLP